MSVLPSLIAALERAAGDCLVLRSGERPHVVAGDARHDVGNTVLSAKAVEALAAQILSPEGLRELTERSSVREVLEVNVGEGSLTARAERAGEEIYVELRRHRRPAKPLVPEPAHAAGDDPASRFREGAPRDRAGAERPAAGTAAEPPPAVTLVGPEQPVTHPEPAVPAAFAVERSEEVAIAAGGPEAVLPAPVAAPAWAPASESMAAVTCPDAAAATLESAEEEPVPEATAPALDEPAMPAAGPVPASVRRGPAPVAPAEAASREVADDLDELIAEAAERGATGLYLREGRPPAARIDERLQPLDDTAVSAARMTEIIASCTSGGEGWTAVDHGAWTREFDLAGLVTCYPFDDAAGSGVVIRLAPRTAAASVQRHVPRQVRRACESEDGLLVVAAPAQADLLAIVAAVGDLAARKRAGYVICLQPGDGFPHPVSGAFVSERTLTGSRGDIAAAVARAVQEAPDILVVAGTEPPAGLEDVIVSAATPGRLVVLGIVAPTAVHAMESVFASVDPSCEPHVRKAFAASLRAAFGYRGLRRIGGGRTAVQDVVVGTGEVQAGLERADFGAIQEIQRQGRDGMRTLDAALARAVSRRQVTLRHAAAHAINRSDLVAFTRRDARERRALAREQRPGEWRQGVLRAI